MESIPLRKEACLHCYDSDSVSVALDIMRTHRIHSVPVFSKIRGPVGIIDALSILKYTTDNDESKHNISDVLSDPGSICDELCVFDESAMLRTLVEYFASGSVHRCLISESLMADPSCSRVISQGDVIHFLSSRIERKDYGKVRDIYEEKRNFLVAPINTRLSNVLMQLYSKNAMNSAVALIDADGKLCGNFTPDDLRCFELFTHDEHKILIRDSMESKLNMTVDGFLEEYSPKSRNPVKIDRDGDISLAISMIADAKDHRIWIIDENSRPLHVVSLTMILKALLNH